MAKPFKKSEPIVINGWYLLVGVGSNELLVCFSVACIEFLHVEDLYSPAHFF